MNLIQSKSSGETLSLYILRVGNRVQNPISSLSQKPADLGLHYSSKGRIKY